MKTSRALIILVAIAAVVLAACVRNVPGASNVAPSAEVQTTAAQPAGTSDAINQIYLFATQTAMAAQGVQPPGQETPSAPVAPADTPAANIEPTAPAIVPPPVQPTAAIVLPTLTPGIPSNYTLHGGEFPYCIARRFNVNPSELLRINGLSTYSVYYSGMTLRIPQTGNGFPGQRALRPHPSTYAVRSGDTIYSVACIYGDVEPESIGLANGLTPPYRLTPGQTINIP